MATPHRPNVLITGTPGTGKTSLAALIAQDLGYRHLEVGKIVAENGLFSGRDEERQTNIVEEDDEDRLLDFMEDMMVKGGNVVDYHSSELFPQRWFQLVIVLRAETENIFDRLTARGYSERKREENLEAEICGVCLEEAMESYDPSIVVERPSNTLEDMEATVSLVESTLGRIERD
jgi:adenylate kinase